MSQSIEDRVSSLELRNKRVELDKKWETSLSRRLLIILLTYLVIGLFMTSISIPSPWLNAIVPSLGFFLSTLTLPFLKKLWLKKHA